MNYFKLVLFGLISLLYSDQSCKKLTIKINNQGFCYNHDEIVDANKETFSEGGSAHRSWSKYRFYSKTNGYPDWANDFIRKI